MAALAIFVMLIFFLPLHIRDVFQENPAIGSKTLAYVRLLFQFVLIYWAFVVKRNAKLETSK